MSSQASLVSKARSNIIKIDPQARIFSDTELSVFLNEAQDKIETDMSDDIPEQQVKSTWSISTGTQEYLMSSVLPNYKKINHIDMNQCNIEEVVDSAGEPNQYCIYWTTLYTNTIPSWSKSVNIFYSKKLPDITTSEDCILPSEYDLALCYYASYLALNSVEKSQKAGEAFGMYKQAIDKLITTNNRRQTYNFINY